MARKSDNARGNEQIDKGVVPEGFTLGLALVDALPVVLFCLACVVAGLRLHSTVFVVGAVVAFIGGAGKVGWKLVIALAHRNVSWLSRQMRVVMPAGFALMLVGLLTSGLDGSRLLAAVTVFPTWAFLVLWVICMCGMGWFAGHLDPTDARSNWIEQLTNTCGQAALLAALLLMP